MAVYVGAVLAFAVMLYLSFRALGTSSVSAEEGGPLLERLCDQVASGVDEVGAGLLASPDGAAEVAREGRRRLTGYEQQMARLDGEGCDPALLHRRDRLASAVETLTWACRMAESAHYHDAPALQRAVAALTADSQAMLAQPDRK